MSKIAANGIDIYYELHGEGPLLILIGGLGTDHSFWNPHIKSFTKDYQVLIYDNRGSGQTTCPLVPYTIDTMADDLAALIDALGFDQGDVIGSSMGAAIATSYAANYPEKIDKLIICSLFGRLNERARLFFDAAIAAYEEIQNPEKYYNLIAPWLYSPNFFDLPQNISAIAFDSNYPYIQPFDGLKGQYSALKSYNYIAKLPQIQCETLILAGEKDALSPQEDALKMARTMSLASLFVFDSAGHLFNYEAPHTFSKLALEFLQNLERGKNRF